MKKSLTALLCLLCITPAIADYDYRHNRSYPNHRHGHHHENWVGPALGGALIGIAIAKAGEPVQTPVIIERVPVPAEQPPIYRLSPGNQAVPCLVPYIDPYTGNKRHEYLLCIR